MVILGLSFIWWIPVYYFSLSKDLTLGYHLALVYKFRCVRPRDTYCLIEVCLAWGGCSITLAQTVIERVCATVSEEQYRPVLEAALALLPTGSRPTLLADRGFEHGEKKAVADSIPVELGDQS